MFHHPIYFTNIIVLTAGGPVGQSLRVSGKRIVEIDGPPKKNDCLIDGQGGLLIPGLINAHDHLALNNFERLKYRERYSHFVEWMADIEARFDADPAIVEPRRRPLADRLLVGALKNLLSGVTTVCHHNPLYRPLRSNYPIRVVKDYGFCHSLFRGDDPATSYKRTNRRRPWIIHLAEGVDDRAAAEFDRLAQLGLVQDNTVLVHGVGLTGQQRRALAESGGGLIWCPGSNNFMFGQTADVKELAQAGKLALGSDSRLSGEFDLLQEVKVARQTEQLGPQQLFQSVTRQAARVLRLQVGGRGEIVVGGEADLLLLPPLDEPDLFAQILGLDRSQLELVLLAGKPLVGSERMKVLFEVTRVRPGGVEVDGVKKLMSRRLISRLRRSSVQEPGLCLG